MPIGNYSFVSRLGWVYALVIALLALNLHLIVSAWAALPLWMLVVFCLYLFRDPDREIPSLPLAIVSPADGVILSVENAQDPYIKRAAIRIKVQMSFWGPYITRSPTEGKILERWFQSPQENVDSRASYGLWVQTDEEDDVVLVMTRRSSLNTPRCYVQSGERIGQGQRCGLIRFGSDLEVYIPVNSKVEVESGDKVEAGSSVIATLVHK